MRAIGFAGWLVLTCIRLDAQEIDTSTIRADSALQAVYRRALAATTNAAARAALTRSQQAWTGYLAAQRELYAALPDRIRSNYTIALEINQRRSFLQRAVLGEWTERDERIAQAEMQADLQGLI